MTPYMHWEAMTVADQNHPAISHQSSVIMCSMEGMNCKSIELISSRE